MRYSCEVSHTVLRTHGPPFLVAMKRRRRGPQDSAYFNLTDANLINLQAHHSNSDSAEHDVGCEGDGGGSAGRPQPVPGRGIPRACGVEEYDDIALSPESASDA